MATKGVLHHYTYCRIVWTYDSSMYDYYARHRITLMDIDIDLNVPAFMVRPSMAHMVTV